MARAYKLAQANMAYSRFSFFIESTIHRFLIAKLTLDDPKRVFHLTAHRGLAVLNISFPVNGVVRNMWQLSGAAVDAVVNAG